MRPIPHHPVEVRVSPVRGRGALGLGLVTLCNHASRPNARVERNFARQTLDLIASATLGLGEEVTIDYRCTLWFEPGD